MKYFLFLFNAQETSYIYQRTVSIPDRGCFSIRLAHPFPWVIGLLLYAILLIAFFASTLTQCPVILKMFSLPTSLRGQICKDACRGIKEIQIWLCYQVHLEEHRFMVTFSTAAWCINLHSGVEIFMCSCFLFPFSKEPVRSLWNCMISLKGWSWLVNSLCYLKTGTEHFFTPSSSKALTSRHEET